MYAQQDSMQAYAAGGQPQYAPEQQLQQQQYVQQYQPEYPVRSLFAETQHSGARKGGMYFI